MSSTVRAYGPLLAAAALVAGLDQLTKELALRALDDGPVDLIPGAVTLRLTTNSGGAFGLLQGHPELFLVATLVIMGGVLIWARTVPASWAIPLGVVVGGGVGNVLDRILRDTDGEVVDFVDLHVWPVFNLADAAIVCGVAAILFLGWREERREHADG